MMVRLAAILLAVLLTSRSGSAETSPTTVFAAASLTSILEDIADSYAGTGQPKPRLVLGSSATLARQIEHGAPADIFISADPKWIDYLATRHLVVDGSDRNLVGNRLVFAVHESRTASIASADQIAEFVDQERLAMADPLSVPAGRYAKQALQSSGQWQSLSGRMVYASDVRATLKLISRAEVSGGIIYATDAAIEPSVHVAYTFPAHSHDPIRYLVALINNAGQDTEDHAFYGFLSGSTAQGLFRKHGFLVRLMDSE